jgi:endogenous inhibitor of DNA gyrase (YacG/DUF329 family)
MRCPTCKREFKPDDSPAKPFCSERCRLIDLGRWLDEGYAVPAIPDPDADEVPDEPDPES